MRIFFERSGGFAGLRLSADFDLDDLSEEDAEKIKELLDDSDFYELPDAFSGPGDIPDQFSYTIKVESKKGVKTVTVGDASAPEDLRELINILNRLMRTKNVK